MMKRYFNKLLSLCLICTLVIPIPVNIVKAQTLRDEKNILYQLQKESAKNESLTAEAKEKINNKRNSITQATNTIAANEEKVEQSKTIVAESEEKIKLRQEELKDVLVALQYTDSNEKELYTDYVFSSSTISEMMERQAIVEQVIEYTKNELDSLNVLIEEKTNLQEKLAQDNITLTDSISAYEKQIEELHDIIDNYATIGIGYDGQIKLQKNVIKMYEDAGCKDNDDIDECYTSKLANSSSFSRPLNSGRVTQAYNKKHAGIDLGGNKPGTNVYAPASGSVIYIARKTNCGGNIIYMQVSVNGKKYTVEFAHLKKIYVEENDFVRKGTVIATVGGDSSTWYYDLCTSGPHLHYAIAYGHYFSPNGRAGWSSFKANTGATAVRDISAIKSTKGWTWKSRY